MAQADMNGVKNTKVIVVKVLLKFLVSKTTSWIGSRPQVSGAAIRQPEKWKGAKLGSYIKTQYWKSVNKLQELEPNIAFNKFSSLRKKSVTSFIS